MALDFEKLKTASTDDLVTLALCELSRLVDAHNRLADALERIAPDAMPAAPADTSDPPPCPCPPEFRVKVDATMGQPVSYKCGICQKPAIEQPVEA